MPTKPGDVPQEINMSSLHDWQVKALHDRVGNCNEEPYRLIRKLTRIVAEVLDCDEASAEAVVLGRATVRIVHAPLDEPRKTLTLNYAERKTR